MRVLATLEHVPKKLLDFFDQNMLQLFESERFLFDQMISSDQEALLHKIMCRASIARNVCLRDYDFLSAGSPSYMANSLTGFLRRAADGQSTSWKLSWRDHQIRRAAKDS